MSRFTNKRLNRLTPYSPGEQNLVGDIIKLNTNESPFPPAPSVITAIKDETIASLRLYSDANSTRLKAGLSRYFKIAPERIFIANGSDEVLNFAFMAFCETAIAFPDITYGFYPVFCTLHGLDAKIIPVRDDLTIDSTDYLDIGMPIVIANPNAPTGLSLSAAEIEMILVANSSQVVIIDEAYIDFGGETALNLLDKYDNLLVVRTYSKSRSLAGARLGFAIGSEELIDALEKIKYSTNPYNVNTLTQKLGLASIEADDYYQKKVASIIKTRDETSRELRSQGLSVLNSKANFLFVRSDAIGGEDLYLSLRERGILVRHFAQERIYDYVRITIGTPEEMNKLVCEIKNIIEGK